MILAGRSGPARLMWRRSILDARLAFVWRSSSPRNRPLLQPLEKVALGSRASLETSLRQRARCSFPYQLATYPVISRRAWVTGMEVRRFCLTYAGSRVDSCWIVSVSTGKFGAATRPGMVQSPAASAGRTVLITLRAADARTRAHSRGLPGAPTFRAMLPDTILLQDVAFSPPKREKPHSLIGGLHHEGYQRPNRPRSARARIGKRRCCLDA